MPLSNPFAFVKKGDSNVTPQATAFTESKNADMGIQPIPHVTEEQPDKYVPDSEAQNGVKKVEAITLSWTRPELIIAYISYVEQLPSTPPPVTHNETASSCSTSSMPSSHPSRPT